MSVGSRLSAGAALRRAQEQSRAGHHEAADKALLDARRRDPALPCLPLQAALAAGRAGQVDEALRRLAEAPAAERSRPPYRLFEGFFLARRGRFDQATALLSELLAQVPENRVVATALAYAHLRRGELDAALALLAAPGDNLELLSWVWLEVERLYLQRRPRPDVAVPPLPFAPAADLGAGRRFFRAAIASAYGYAQVVWRQRLLSWRAAAPLHGLLRALERRWPTNALAACQLARAAGLDGWEVRFHLGAQLYEAGCHEAALVELDAASAAAEAALAESLAGSSPERAAAARRDWEATEETCQVRLYRAAVLVELRRWDEAEAALTALAAVEADDSDDSGRTHEFALPDWYMRRALVRLARDKSDAARADFERALDGDPALFEHRLKMLTR